MVRMISRLALVAAIASTCSACATIDRGTRDTWRVSTRPSGARVETSNGFFCAWTPCEMKIPRKARFTATVTKQGYKTVTVQVTNRVSGEGALDLAGNAIIGGLIGVGVDVYSGASLDLTPNPLSIDLQEEDRTVPPPQQ